MEEVEQAQWAAGLHDGQAEGVVLPAEDVVEDVTGRRRSGRRPRVPEQFEPRDIFGPNVDYVVRPGKGRKLRDVPNVSFLIEREPVRSFHLKALFKICYGRHTTSPSKRKQLLLDFSGIQEADREHTMLKIGRLLQPDLKLVMKLCDIRGPAGSAARKEDLATALLHWVECPMPSGRRDLREMERKRQEVKMRQRERAKFKKESSPKKLRLLGDKPPAVKDMTPGPGEEGKKEAPSLLPMDAKEVLLAVPVPVAVPVAVPLGVPQPGLQQPEQMDKVTAEKDDGRGRIAVLEQGEEEEADVDAELPGDVPVEDLKAEVRTYLQTADLATVTFQSVLSHLQRYFGLDLGRREKLIRQTIEEWMENHV